MARIDLQRVDQRIGLAVPAGAHPRHAGARGGRVQRQHLGHAAQPPGDGPTLLVDAELLDAGEHVQRVRVGAGAQQHDARRQLPLVAAPRVLDGGGRVVQERRGLLGLTVQRQRHPDVVGGLRRDRLRSALGGEAPRLPAGFPTEAEAQQRRDEIRRGGSRSGSAPTARRPHSAATRPER